MKITTKQLRRLIAEVAGSSVSPEGIAKALNAAIQQSNQPGLGDSSDVEGNVINLSFGDYRSGMRTFKVTVTEASDSEQ